jgi:hypothetical protein
MNNTNKIHTLILTIHPSTGQAICSAYNFFDGRIWSLGLAAGRKAFIETEINAEMVDTSTCNWN